jgi:hypothetical protein
LFLKSPQTHDFAKLPIKFKPWEALKWAKALKTFGAVLSVALDALGGFLDFYNEHKLAEEKGDILNQIDELFKEFLSSFTKSDYIKAYFPVIELKQNLRKDVNAINQSYKQKIEQINGFLFDLETERRRLNKVADSQKPFPT